MHNKELNEKEKMGELRKQVELIIVPVPSVSHLGPTVEFAKRLINHEPGMTVTILNIQFPHGRGAEEYIQSLDLATIGGGRLRFIDLPTVDQPSPDQFQTRVGFASVHVQNHKSQVKQAIDDLIGKSTESGANPVRLGGLIIDMFFTPLIDVANELGIPCYVYFTSPATSLGFVSHLPRLDAEVAIDFEDSPTEFSVPSFVNSVPPRVLPYLVLRKNQDGYTWSLYHARRFNEAKGILVNSFEELEPHAFGSFSAHDLPPVYPVGPIINIEGLNPRHPNWTQHQEIMKWLDLQPPSSVVLLCFGTMGSLSKAQVREIAMALELTGYRFLWSLRRQPETQLGHPAEYTNFNEVLPDGFLERTAQIGLVCGWVPQAAVLGHKAIGGFVSHCGWNSILEALWHGVPIATWPLHAEQQMNAFEMVVELKLAVEVKMDYRDGRDHLVLGEEVGKCLRNLMDGDPELRNRVKEMSLKCRNAVGQNGSSYKSLGCIISEILASV